MQGNDKKWITRFEVIQEEFLYEKAGTGYWVLGAGLGISAPYFFNLRCGWWLQPCGLLENKNSGQPQQSPPEG